MIANDLLSLLRHPLTGEELVGDFPAEDHGGCAGLTGMLRSASGEFPVIGGVVIFRADLATDKVKKYARSGDYRRALFWALKCEKKSTRAAVDLWLRLKWPRLLQSNGSPYGTFAGDTGAYLRFRYYVPNFPTCVGVLSCLKRTASTDGYVLDVGSGFGHFYNYFLHSYPPDKIILLDSCLEALVTASRFVDRRTVLVCCDANGALPFRSNVFSDIVALDAFQYLWNKEGFVSNAIEVLDARVGSLWLTNNWNPRITSEFTGVSRAPSQWRSMCDSSKWRIFPDRHFADPVLRGGALNIGLNYVPQDDHPDWRSVTLVYSNASWHLDNKFIPLNRAPSLQRLSLNPIYCSPCFARRVVRRRVRLKYWESHRKYYGFYLPETYRTQKTVGRRNANRLQSLAETLVMVECLCRRRQSFLSGYFSLFRAALISFVSQSQFSKAIRPFVPERIRTVTKKLLMSNSFS